MPMRLKDFQKRTSSQILIVSTAQLVVALKPLHDKAKIKRVVVSTYQSVSGAGKEAMDELFNQTRAVFVADPVEAVKFPKRIAFNVIPHIDVFMEDGLHQRRMESSGRNQKDARQGYQGYLYCCACTCFL